MRRRFNITGSCNPQRQFMVNLDDRLKRIKEDYVDEGEYFVINKGRQYVFLPQDRRDVFQGQGIYGFGVCSHV